MKSIIRTGIILILPVVVCVSACGIYSFTGANISPDVTTISVDYFFNESGDGPPNLGQLFTEGIKDYYQNNTNLGIDNTGNGDLQLTGNISNYRYSPIAPTASGSNDQPDNAGLQRLTISVRVQYTNTKDDSFDFDQTFTFYADFDQNAISISAAEPVLIEDIFKQLYVDIFNASVANW